MDANILTRTSYYYLEVSEYFEIRFFLWKQTRLIFNDFVHLKCSTLHDIDIFNEKLKVFVISKIQLQFFKFQWDELQHKMEVEKSSTNNSNYYGLKSINFNHWKKIEQIWNLIFIMWVVRDCGCLKLCK